MNSLLVLQGRAVRAAQDERWEEAVKFNQEIIDLDDTNIGAYNRLGFAYLQLGQTSDAKKAYECVLKKDPANAVARKYWQSLQKKQPLRLPKALKHNDFIDEPGKTRSVHLVRLAGNDRLNQTSIGDDCKLDLKKTRIGVMCDGNYIGTLPDDLFLRLHPLLEAGNTYQVRIQSLRNNQVVVFLRELTRAPSVANTPSFPVDNSLLAQPIMSLDREDSKDSLDRDYGDEPGDALSAREIDDALSHGSLDSEEDMNEVETLNDDDND